jgi:hypothetical protein
MDQDLIEQIVPGPDDHYPDSEEIRDQFVEIGREYIDEADDPSTETVEVLIEHFEDRDPDDMDEETLALLWSKSSILRWMVDDLPLQRETMDPEWLRQQLNSPLVKALDDRSEDIDF